ncbi:DUF1236 domain-containing protein [Pseudaminobacter salicylatoxidans]|uniref:DUF1236 domain-containing protein n=1 Tax=Pseudaminobacter salicylatoxidans TaxID=93369 RepID=UPI0002F3C0AB|nr:DUF1236 domain-containing protein [Pseudaminobacter salicylatoxidans]
MRQILIKSAIVLAIGIAPGLAGAQTEAPIKKHPEQSEGKGGGEYGKGGMKKEGVEGGTMKMEKKGGQPMEKPSMKSEGKETEKPKAQSKEQGKATSKKTEEQSGSQGKRAEKGHVSEEQRGELRKALREGHVEPAPNINFSVDLGVRVPREVHLYRLPPRIVEIVPEYEGYEYFVLADGRIIIVDPETLEIVLILA